MKVKRRIYRFRVLNAVDLARPTGSRSATASPMTVVATDGGLCRVPQTVRRAARRDGRALRGPDRLLQVPARPAGGPASNLALPNNVDFPSTRERHGCSTSSATRSTTTNNTMPATLVDRRPAMRLTASDAVAHAAARVPPRRTGTGRSTARPGTTSSTAASQVVANPGLNDIEIWELANKSGGWFHPVHIHLRRLQDPRAATAGRRSTTSSGRRTSPTSARTRRCG